MQRQGGLEARDGELVKGPQPAADGGPALTGVHYELSQQRVVVRGHRVAGVEVGVYPDPRTPRRVVHLDEPGLGQKVAPGILGVDAELHGVPVRGPGLVGDLQALAGGDFKLLGHDVHASDHLRHGVLDLEARVHLDKVELAPAVDELDGPGPLVIQGGYEVFRGGREALPDLPRQARRGRLLDELLVAALDRAVPLGEGDRRTRRIRQHLHLDVAQPLQKPLDVDRAVAEVGPGLPARAHVGVRDLGLGLHHAHPLPPSPGARLDDQRVADLGTHALHLGGVPAEPVGARGHGDAGPRGGGAGRHLVAHEGYGARIGAHELQADALADLGEAGVLGEKAVTRVDRVSTRQLGRRDDRGHVQVAARRRRRADADRLVGQLVVQRVGVGGGVDGHAPYAELAAGPDDAQGYLPAVGHEDLAEHYCPASGRRYRSGWSYSTPPAFSARISTTSPETSVTISFISFIASTMQTVCPALTLSPTST